MQGSRSARVAQLVREVVTSALAFGEVKDPRVRAAELVTVTHVQVSGDLRYAKVYVVVSGGEPAEVVEGLQAARGFLRRQVGERLQTRFTPDLHFLVDEEFEQGQNIERLLREVGAEKSPDPPEPETTAKAEDDK